MIYLSGASGFVGQHLVKELESRKLKYTAIPHQKLRQVNYQPFSTYFFLSSYGNHYNQHDFDLAYKANVEDLKITLDKVKRVEFMSFVHVSTSSIQLPTQTAYSATKKVGETIVECCRNVLGMNAFSVRPYSLFGEGEADFRFIPTMVRQIVMGQKPLLDTTPIHDWVYVKDFVLALLMLSKQKVNMTVPVGFGEPRSNLTVYKDICRYLELAYTYPYRTIKNSRSYDVNDWFNPDTEIMRRFRIKAQYGYKEGLFQTVKHYRKLYAKRRT